LARLIESQADAVEVVSVGRQLEIGKQVGSPKNLDATYSVKAITGMHESASSTTWA
jgi:glutamate synthase domain-containing protein 1